MILSITKKKQLLNLIEFFQSFFSYDFYITENNTRIYISDYTSIKKLFSQSIKLLAAMDKERCLGVLSVWKSVGGDTTRYYLKLGALDNNIADKLLTILIWNFTKDLHVKVRKDNKFLGVLKRKGFRFQAGRGSQVLLFRKYIAPIRKTNEHNINEHRDASSISSERDE